MEEGKKSKSLFYFCFEEIFLCGRQHVDVMAHKGLNILIANLHFLV